MELQVLALVTFVAAIVNGAVGYGFSSLTVPIALLFLSNKVLNPALVIVAIALNGYVLVVNRRSIPVVAKRALPVLLGLVPGIICGGLLLASLNSEWLKFVTYISLVPLILLQAGGVRWPMKSERMVGLLLAPGLERFIPQRRSPGRRWRCYSTIRASSSGIFELPWHCFEWLKRFWH